MAQVNADMPLPGPGTSSHPQPMRTKKVPVPKRRYRRTRSAPIPPGAVQNPQGSSYFQSKNIFNNLHPNISRVIIFLVIYLGVGTLYFSIMNHQIKGQKRNAVLDAIYLSVVTMTTVGYGDLVPNSVFTKIVTCAYVFLGMALVGLMLTKAADYLLERQEDLLIKAMSRNSNSDTILNVTQESETNRVKYKCLIVTIILVVLCSIGIPFLMAVEKMNFVHALYCVCCTISTLGYGDTSFSTKGGRAFAIFWIPAGTLCAALFYLYIAELATERKRIALVKKVLTRKMNQQDLEAADFDGDGAVE